MLTITVIDGQGGGIGSAILTQCKAQLSSDVFLVAVGTNAVATAHMLKAGADVGATGENAVCYNAAHCDILLAPIGAAFANSMYGEITDRMALAVSKSEALRILIPVNKCDIHIPGIAHQPMTYFVEEAVNMVASHIRFLG